MKLITETIENIEVLTEEKNGKKDYKIKGSGYTIFKRTLPLNFKNIEELAEYFNNYYLNLSKNTLNSYLKSVINP